MKTKSKIRIDSRGRAKVTHLGHYDTTEMAQLYCLALNTCYGSKVLLDSFVADHQRNMKDTKAKRKMYAYASESDRLINIAFSEAVNRHSPEHSEHDAPAPQPNSSIISVVTRFLTWNKKPSQ